MKVKRLHPLVGPDMEGLQKDYNDLLAKEPEEQRELQAVKDEIFHRLIRPDGHGYCRTYGSGPHPSSVYPKSSSAANVTPIVTPQLLQQITEQVRVDMKRELREEIKIEYEQKNHEFKAQIMNWLESNDRISASSHVQGPNMSGQPRESVGEGANDLSTEEEAVATQQEGLEEAVATQQERLVEG